jgi:hypothetical protein
MCNPKRRRPAAESALDEEDGDTEESAEADNKAAKGKQAKQTKPIRQSLLGDLTPSMPPILVFTGPPQKAPEEGIVARPAKAESAAKPAKTESTVKPAKEKPKPEQEFGLTAPATAAAAKPKEPQKQQPKK